MDQIFIIPRTSDQGVVDAFRKLATKFPTTGGQIVAGAAVFQIDSKVTASEDLNTLLELKSYVISQMSMYAPGLHAIYWRGRKGESKSPVFDEVEVGGQPQSGQPHPSNRDRMQFAAAVADLFKAGQIDTSATGLLPPEQAHVLAAHATTLERLEDLNENLIERSSEFRKSLEEDFVNRRRTLEQQVDVKKVALEEEYQRKDQAIADREVALKETLKRIDDRNNTHVRREIRDRMLNDVKDRIAQFGVSRATEDKRKPVTAGIVFLCLVFAALAFFAGMEVYNFDRALESAPAMPLTPYYLMWVRLGLFCFGLFGSILYMVRWEKKWAEEHATAEFQLQQFYIDVNRANWVIESCLEWRKETKSAIPKELLESVTRNLFVNEKKSSEQVVHPADELASALLGSASSVKLNVAGNEIQFGKPAKIAKEVKVPSGE